MKLLLPRLSFARQSFPIREPLPAEVVSQNRLSRTYDCTDYARCRAKERPVAALLAGELKRRRGDLCRGRVLYREIVSGFFAEVRRRPSMRRWQRQVSVRIYYDERKGKRSEQAQFDGFPLSVETKENR